MIEDKDCSWAIHCGATLAAGDDASVLAWIGCLVPSLWGELGSPSGMEPVSAGPLSLAWGAAGIARESREVLFELRGGPALASGLVRIEPHSGSATAMVVIHGAQASVARRTLVALLESAPPVFGRVVQARVDPHDGDPGAPQHALGWLVWRESALPEGGPWRRRSVVATGWLIEAYDEADLDKPDRLRAILGWAPWTSDSHYEGAHDSADAAPLPPSQPPAPRVDVPSYMRQPLSGNRPGEGSASPARRQERASRGASALPAAPASAPRNQLAPSNVGAFAVPAPCVGTEEIDLSKLRDIVMASPTPFVGATSPKRLADLLAEAAGLDETVLPKNPSSSGDDPDETMMMPTAGLRAQIDALPFESAFPELDVERYAALVAELQVKGATAAVLARYRVTGPAALMALKTEQERRFAADPAQRTRFEQRVAHYLSFMRPGSSR